MLQIYYLDTWRFFVLNFVIWKWEVSPPPPSSIRCPKGGPAPKLHLSRDHWIVDQTRPVSPVSGGGYPRMSGAWVVAPPLAYTNPDLLNKRLLLLFKLRLFLTERPSPFFLILAKEKNIANVPKSLSTLTHSTPLVQSRSFNKLWNLGQTSAWFCLAKVDT